MPPLDTRLSAIAAILSALACPAAFGEENVAAPSLRGAVARHVAALPSGAFVLEVGGCGSTSGTTCCRDGCRDATPPREETCAGTPGRGLSLGLGAMVGTGLGLGIGHDSAEGPLSKEFQPFGLTDSLITAGAVAVAAVGYKAVDREPPALCRGGFSGCTGTEDSLRGIDAYIRRHWVRLSPRGRRRAGSLSDLGLAATLALPSAFLVAAGQPAQGREFWLTVESGAITAALLQVVKHRVNRPRPYAHYCEPDCGDDLGKRDAQVSFFSGHTALAVSFAVSAGTIASMRSYPHAGWVLGGGLTMAATTGYLRIAADRHYFTDVLTGALVGAAVGWAVPHLHGMRDSSASDSSTAARRPPPRPALVLPVPLRGTQGRLWLHGGVGGGASGLTLSWTF